MSRQKNRRYLGHVALLGLTVANAMLFLYLRHSRLPARAVVDTLVKQGEQRGREQAWAEVQMLVHGELQAHVFALQQCLFLAQGASFGELQYWLGQAQAQTRTLLKQMRRLYAQIEPTASTTDFEQSLRDVAASLSAAYPDCSYRVEVLGYSPSLLSPQLQRALIIVLYNALENAHLHGQPTSIHVQLRYAPDAVVLVVGDNGNGLLPESITSKGRGMSDMQRAIERVGGWLRVESKPGQGTSVSAMAPVLVVS